MGNPPAILQQVNIPVQEQRPQCERGQRVRSQGIRAQCVCTDIFKEDETTQVHVCASLPPPVPSLESVHCSDVLILVSVTSTAALISWIITLPQDALRRKSSILCQLLMALSGFLLCLCFSWLWCLMLNSTSLNFAITYWLMYSQYANWGFIWPVNISCIVPSSRTARDPPFRLKTEHPLYDSALQRPTSNKDMGLEAISVTAYYFFPHAEEWCILIVVVWGNSCTVLT